jgi:GNAT superfamily N-acetyltransferase
MKLEFSTFFDSSEASLVTEMMRQLYKEDPAGPGNAPTETGFENTVRILLQNPERGRIVLMIDENLVQGYAILIPYWSNEFGGTILFVDELFVKPQARGRGIGRRFFEFVRTQKPFDAVACALEVSPKNDRARRFYESTGFAPRGHTMMVSRL